MVEQKRANLELKNERKTNMRNILGLEASVGAEKKCIQVLAGSFCRVSCALGHYDSDNKYP